MKVSVTDKFLWDVYNVVSKTGEIIDSLDTRKDAYNYLFGPDNPIFKKYRKEKGRREFNNLIYYLKRKGYIKAKNLKNKQGVILTKQGIDKAFMASFKLGKGKKRKDGKLVMLIFDMPRRHVKARDLLRSILRNLGYKLFQHSVWITPFDVSDKTEKLLLMHSLDQYVRIFIIEEL